MGSLAFARDVDNSARCDSDWSIWGYPSADNSEHEISSKLIIIAWFVGVAHWETAVIAEMWKLFAFDEMLPC